MKNPVQLAGVSGLSAASVARRDKLPLVFIQELSRGGAMRPHVKACGSFLQGIGAIP